MYTLIEIFDAKQYENILSPIMLDKISKVIYVGTKEVMTSKKISNLKNFFFSRKSKLPIEFLYVERDNSDSVKRRFEQIVRENRNCIFDVTGGEDVILAVVGIIASRFNVPVIRIDTKSGKVVQVHAKATDLCPSQPDFSTNDAIILQGGKILRYETIDSFTNEDIDTLKLMFDVNCLDCESYSAFCNAMAESVTANGRKIVLNESEYQKRTQRTNRDIGSVTDELCRRNLLTRENTRGGQLSFKINSPLAARCITKAGNVLEYYTAYAASSLTDIIRDIKVGVNIEWNDNSEFLDTQNEIDVMAVSNLYPLFISCKNGDVKKDALYELDAVSRALGGAYAKKVLVCTYISKNKSAREHFIKRARDMGIGLVRDAHKLSFDEFLYYLRKAVR